MGDIRDILTQLSEILARYDYDERASFVRGLVEGPTQDDDFWQTLAGLEFWGGSGAVWEIGPFHLTDPSIAMPPSDYRRFKALMVELADILDAKGLGAQASGIAEVFRGDLGAGL